MTKTTQGPAPSAGDRELTAEEIDAFQREEFFADPVLLSPEHYPRAWNISAGMLYKRVIRARVPVPPEYVTVPVPGPGSRSVELRLAVAEWNLLWEAAQFRRRFFDEEHLPAAMRDVADRGDVNVVFVPRTATRYHEYAPLYHLLPRATAERFGLPLLRAGQWPYLADVSDPIRLLAHNLDFWLPAVAAAIQEILRSLPVVDQDIPADPPLLQDGSVLEGAVAASPRIGSDLWRGEAEAAEVVRQTVQEADAGGRLRGILDAVRSNRVEDDFSAHWSYAREDFERKLYRKRSKVKVRFVELADTIPVQGPETEVQDSLVFGDFLALLDERERQVVVLLSSGVTKIGDVAAALGYKNHSPVSKRLARIRKKAAEYFGDD